MNTVSDILQSFIQKQQQRYGQDFFVDDTSGKDGVRKITLMTSSLQEQLSELLQAAKIDNVQVSSLEEKEGIELIVKSGVLNLFTKREENFGLLADQILPGESIRVLKTAKSGEWVPVAVHHNFEDQTPKELGWLIFDSKKIQSNSQIKDQTRNVSKNNFYTLAKEFVSKNSGIIYFLGGKTAELGFDCSGFVQVMIYKLSNLWLPRLSRWQSLVGQEINTSNIQPLDIVYFSDLSGKVKHVGLVYRTNNRLPTIIHAPARSNGIVIEDLNQASWLGIEQNITGYRRIFENII